MCTVCGVYGSRYTFAVFVNVIMCICVAVRTFCIHVSQSVL